MNNNKTVLNELMEKYMLNEPQARVVINESRQLIVPAGAGSGKTKTLVNKVVYLLKKGFPLESFLVLTFTKKAATEMKTRIKKELKKEGLTDLVNKIDSSDISTFDSFAYNFVKQNASYLNLDSNLELLDPSVFNITKTKMMQEIIINIMNYNDLNNNYYQFVYNYSSSKSADRLINNLIGLYEKLVNIKPLNNFSVEELLDKTPLFNNRETEEEINKVNNMFLQIPNNREQVNYLFNKANEVMGINNTTHYESKRFSWKELSKVESDKIKKILEPYTDLIKTNLTKVDYDNLLLEFREDIKVILSILTQFENELNNFKNEYNKYEFRDISNFLNVILKENETVLQRTKERYLNVFVDEYQDTSLVQSDFLEMLIKDNDNLKVLYVGDIKQSIYKFRDAKPETFINKLAEVDNISLTTNYRSSSKIISFVNNIFSNILTDVDKHDINYLDGHYMESGSKEFSDSDDSSNVFLIEQYNESENNNVAEEAFIVGNKIKQLLKEKKINQYKDVAILSRDKTGFKIYKEVFQYLGIPIEFQIDVDLKQTYLLKLISNILHLATTINSNDKELIDRKRFNYVSLTRSELVELSDYTIFNDLINIADNSKILNINNELYSKLLKLNKIIKTRSNTEIVDFVINEFNIFENISKAPNQFAKELQINFLYNIAKTLSDINIYSTQFVNYIDELSYDNENPIKVSVVEEKIEDNVIITNIHQSKGLEYNTLFLTGLNKNFSNGKIGTLKYFNQTKLFLNKNLEHDKKVLLEIMKINANKKESAETLKEELRLLYVAITRAKKALYLIGQPKDDYSKLNSYNDYLYEHGLLTYIDEKNVEVLRKSYLEENYYLNLKDNNKYYHNKIDELEKHQFNFNEVIIDNIKSSNEITTFLDNKTKDLLKRGSKLHLEFEYGNLINEKILTHNFINKNYNEATIHTELPFSYINSKDNKLITGIIDLVLEYKDEIHIIDYKTNNLDKEKYYNQLLSYKNYLLQIFPNKNINAYLYSIVSDKIEKVI